MSINPLAQLGRRPKGQGQEINHAEEVSKPDTAEQI